MKLRNQYNESGYVILRSCLSDAQVSTIGEHVERIYQQWLCENETEIFSSKLVNMHSLTRVEYFSESPEERVNFFKAIVPVELTGAIEGMFGGEIYFHNTQLFFNPTNSARLPYWHRDMQYSPIKDSVQREAQNEMLSLHIRIPLVQEKGVALIVGSHKRWDTVLERDVRFELNDHTNNDSLPNTVLIDLAPGDVLIFNAQMIHRGNYELNTMRKALDVCVGEYHPLTFEYLDESVLPSDCEMKDIDNNEWYKRALNLMENKSSC